MPIQNHSPFRPATYAASRRAETSIALTLIGFALALVLVMAAFGVLEP